MKTRFGIVLALLGAWSPSWAEVDPPQIETRGIQAAIDAASAAGGGRVTVTEGVHRCGTLRLRSGVELHFEKGAVLLGGERSEDYDDAVPQEMVYDYDGAVPETATLKAFIVADGATNVAITGEGTIDARGPAFFDRNSVLWRFYWAKPKCFRPRMLVFNRCRGVRLEGVTLKDSPTWTVWLRRCEDVTVSRLRIDCEQRMINSDGIDIDGCRHVRIGNSFFRTGDDSLVLRAIRGPGGEPSVTEDVVVTNCVLESACQGVRVGCPSDDTIRNALFRDIVFRGRNAIGSEQVRTYLEKGCSGRLATENVRFENWTADCWGRAFDVFVDPGIRLPRFGGLTFSNFVVRADLASVVRGTEESPIRGLRFADVRGSVAAERPFETGHVPDASFENCTMTADGDLVLTAVNTEVLVAAGASPAARFAAEELTNFLSRAFAASVPLAAERTPGRVSIVLGDGEEARAAGIDVPSLPLDAFSAVVTRTPKGGGVICIAGRDDPKVGPRQLMEARLQRLERTERATLNGAYDFLERHFGIRFYFPGEIGTIVPRTAEVRIPRGARTEVPDFLVRRVYLPADGVWYEGVHTNLKPYRPCAPKALNWMRLRLQSGDVPCVHGQSTFRYTERFGKEHPEYFRLMENGQRNLEVNPERENDSNTRQLCHTSRVWDEIYADARAYLSGRPASERGLERWSVNTYGGRYVDIMPQDGFRPCQCAACKAAYTTKYGPHYATDLIWSNTVAVANRLRVEGVKGCVTQMAYTPYAGIPDVDIPDNVRVMVAEGGPWSVGAAREKEWRHVEAWADKVKGKVWVWTYLGKISNRKLPDVPQMSPHAYAEYFQHLAPRIFGAFCESESDRAIFNYLNYYVFARIGWDSGLDVDAVLDEHHRLMFGAGAGPMKRFYEEMERKWVREICGAVEDTPIGPLAKPMTFREICAGPYSEAELVRLEGLFAAALAAVPADSPEAKRIAFIRNQFLGPIATAVRTFVERTSPARALERRRKAGASRSMLRDAEDFAAIGPDGVWRAEKNPRGVARDAATCVTAPGCLRLTTDGATTFVAQSLEGRLRPNTRYRLSYFLKIGDLQPTEPKKSGFFIQCYDRGTWHWFPRGAQQFGTVDWSYEEHEFTTSESMWRTGEPRLEIMLRHAKGTVWLDDIRLEEIAQAGH